LGYRPPDDSEPRAAAILAAEAGQPKDPIAGRYQGGTFLRPGTHFPVSLTSGQFKATKSALRRAA
jgi:hypothetical protein